MVSWHLVMCVWVTYSPNLVPGFTVQCTEIGINVPKNALARSILLSCITNLGIGTRSRPHYQNVTESTPKIQTRAVVSTGNRGLGGFWSECVCAPSASFKHDGTTIIIDFFSSFGPSVCVRHRRLSDTMVPL